MARNTWMRGCAAALDRRAARSTSQRCRPRQAGDRSAGAPRLAMARTASKSPSEAIGKPGLDDVHAEHVELPRQAQLLGGRHAEAGRLLAVAQGRVENPDADRVAHAPLVSGVRCH